jgi:hypothetical protein
MQGGADLNAATGPAPRSASRLTRWSYLMVPVFAVVFIANEALTLPVLDALGLGEGELYVMQRGAAGWTAEILSALALLAAPLAGVLLAAAARRRGGRKAALAALILNVLLVCLVLYAFADHVRMTYWPQW